MKNIVKYFCRGCGDYALFSVPSETKITQWECKCGYINTED